VLAGELFHRNAPVNPFDLSPQEISQGRQIEFFACSNRSGVAMHKKETFF